MVSWTDAYERWHDKPTDGEKPSSNNGYIYSAYAKNLGLLKKYHSIADCFQKSIRNLEHVNFTRHPDIWLTDGTPPPSRDEVLGLVSLGILDASHLINNQWCFWIEGDPLDRLDWFNIVLEMLKLSGKHRNEVWTGNYPHAKQLAFRLNFHDVFYVKSMNGLNTSVEEEMLWSYYVDDMKSTDDWSAKNICIMQMEDISLNVTHMKKAESYTNYFQAGHPFLDFLQE